MNNSGRSAKKKKKKKTYMKFNIKANINLNLCFIILDLFLHKCDDKDVVDCGFR